MSGDDEVLSVVMRRLLATGDHVRILDGAHRLPNGDRIEGATHELRADVWVPLLPDEETVIERVMGS